MLAVPPPDVHEPPEVHLVADGVRLVGELVEWEVDAEVSAILLRGRELAGCRDNCPDASHIK